jgi:hypothetical protein
MNKHGSYVGHLEDDKILNITQLFLTGELWGIDAYAIDKDCVMKRSKVDFGYFPCVDLEKAFIYTLANYLKFASEALKLQLPLRFIAGATDVKGYRMSSPQGFNFISGRFDGHVLADKIVHEGTITNYSVKASDILRPFFEYVWEECGLERPDKEVLG